MTSALRLVLGVMVVSSTLVARVALAGEGEPPEGPRGRTVLCESRNYQRAYCPSPVPLEQVVLAQVVSGSACVQGQSWGFDRTGVWVDRGCRAYFRLIAEGSPQPVVVNITCSSWNYQFATCDTGLNVLSVSLASQQSHTACVQGQNWGFDNHSIWVNAGCRGTFTVSGTTR